MSDPTPQLQAVALKALRESALVAEAFAALDEDTPRLVEIPPPDLSPPYVVLQAGSTVPLQAGGMDIGETELTATAWTLSDPPNVEDVLPLANAVLAALRSFGEIPGYAIAEGHENAPLAPPTVWGEPRRSIYSVDHDGRTAKAAITVAYAWDALGT